MTESLPADFDDIVGNFAKLYSELTFPVAAGTYCIHEGVMYKANTLIESSETWTSSHWTQVNTGEEMVTLKNDVGQIVVTSLADTVKYIYQNKSDEAKAQARTNIGAASADDVDDLKSALNIVEDNDFNFSAISLNTSADGWKLIDSGLCTSDSNYTLKKYKVTAGDVVRVISDYKFQFQNAASVPSSGTSNRVGATYNAGTFLLEVPAGATYLIISTPKTESTAAAYLGESKNSKQDADIILLDKNKAEESAVGFNVWDEQWETNAGGTYIKSKNLIEVMPGTVYYLHAPNDFSYGVKQYNVNKEVIKTTYPGRGAILTTESTTKYLSFAMDTAYGTTYNNDICINVSQPNANIEPHNGQYVPYGYIGIYRDVLKNKSDIYTQAQAFNTEKSNTAKTLLEVSQKTGATLKDISTHSHSTVLNQSTTQTNISIPKNYKVTISFSDANVEGNGAVYLKYKNSESAVMLAGSILMNGGSYTFVTTDETEYFSLYKNSGVTVGTMTITIDYHYEDSLIGLPTHYVDHMVTQTASVLSNMMTAGKNGETFIFISDLHWENNVRNSPALVKYLLDNLNINFLLCGGDLINEGLKDAEAKTMVECIRAFNFKNTFLPCAFGNHDSNKNAGNAQDRWFDENAEYALMQKQAEDHITYFTETGWNFYFDAEQTKTRWIVCDTQENGAFTWYDELCALLNDTPDGYHVIISGHWFYSSGSKSTFAVNLESIVDAFNARSSVTISSTPYSFANAKGSIPFVIGGHMHKDMDWTTTAGIPFILTDCDNGPRSENTDYPYVKGTITEQAFDVVTVDYENETVKCVRIGRGADRNFTF